MKVKSQGLAKPLNFQVFGELRLEYLRMNRVGRRRGICDQQRSDWVNRGRNDGGGLGWRKQMGKTKMKPPTPLILPLGRFLLRHPSPLSEPLYRGRRSAKQGRHWRHHRPLDKQINWLDGSPTTWRTSTCDILRRAGKKEKNKLLIRWPIVLSQFQWMWIYPHMGLLPCTCFCSCVSPSVCNSMCKRWVCVCRYLHMLVSLCVSICVRIGVCRCARVFAGVCIGAYRCVHASVCALVQLCVLIYVCLYVCVFAFLHLHICQRK